MAKQKAMSPVIYDIFGKFALQSNTFKYSDNTQNTKRGKKTPTFVLHLQKQWIENIHGWSFTSCLKSHPHPSRIFEGISRPRKSFLKFLFYFILILMFLFFFLQEFKTGITGFGERYRYVVFWEWWKTTLWLTDLS